MSPVHAFADPTGGFDPPVGDAHPEPPVGLCAAGLVGGPPIIPKGKRFHILSDNPGAVRRRRTTARQGKGLKSVRIDVHRIDIAKALIARERLSPVARERLSPDETRRPLKVKAALEEIIADFVARWLPLYRDE
ncbi:hypothetical protein SAMN05216330_112146 [Bradyrhizobium sp. Ghvi]|uniref:hypothetical protein n=1 Tax=Bradyrhizobium sp. Ghvi TaxID=1855319 RepID=UPI0008E00F65|nr:hypothetical protein [Bradyrhizobium sp. Ghvi]SFP94925.1 hypothetical protein SAMN05216330_112146 [Bradyrhizobium sp. Ghvi]